MTEEKETYIPQYSHCTALVEYWKEQCAKLTDEEMENILSSGIFKDIFSDYVKKKEND